mgnify:CR=1 FL=1
MMNFKKLSLGLALTTLGIMGLSVEADAYSFKYVGSSAASGGNTNFNFSLSEITL